MNLQMNWELNYAKMSSDTTATHKVIVVWFSKAVR